MGFGVTTKGEIGKLRGEAQEEESNSEEDSGDEEEKDEVEGDDEDKGDDEAERYRTRKLTARAATTSGPTMDRVLVREVLQLCILGVAVRSDHKHRQSTMLTVVAKRYFSLQHKFCRFCVFCY